MEDHDEVGELQRQITELKQEVRRLKPFELLAYSCDMTGLRNYRYLKDEIERRITDADVRSNRYEAESPFRYALLLFDLNKFKQINDDPKGGHLAGDEVLVQIAESVPRAIRKGDTFVRIHGDEFAITALAKDEAELKFLAERVRLQVLNTTTTYKGQKWQVSTSIGGTFLTQNDTFDSVFNRADIAMYRAKKLENPDGAYCFEADE